MAKQEMVRHTICAEWTGDFPHLCHGEWRLLIDGADYSDTVPFRHKPAGTYGNYSRWSFDDDMRVEDLPYVAGMQEDEWIDKYADWLRSLPIGKEEYGELFRSFQEEDWRPGSCGGCI